jgi:hypothetical protein
MANAYLERIIALTSGGPEDSDDNRDDEHPRENEAVIREVDDQTEAPEEFKVDDEDDVVDVENDSVDDEADDD